MKKYNSLWANALATRSAKTILQCLLAMVIIGLITHEINWPYIINTCLCAGLISTITSLFGLPEAKTDGVLEIDTHDPTKDLYRLSLDGDITTLPEKKIVILSVDPKANLSQK